MILYSIIASCIKIILKLPWKPWLLISKVYLKSWSWMQSNVNGSKFFTETTVHVFSRIKFSMNPYKRFFWMLISVCTFAFCTVHICLEILKMKSNAFVVNSRSFYETEKISPVRFVKCVKHWLEWVDFDIIRKYQLTKQEFMALVSLFGLDARYDKCPTVQDLESAVIKMDLMVKNNSLKDIA